MKGLKILVCLSLSAILILFAINCEEKINIIIISFTAAIWFCNYIVRMMDFYKIYRRR